MQPGNHGARVDRLLVVCTGNAIRSRMVESLLVGALRGRPDAPIVSSAGTRPATKGLDETARAELARRRFALPETRPQPIRPEIVAESDLVVTMTRAHARAVIEMDQSAWPRTFPLRALVRRGEVVGARPPGEPLRDWLSRLHAGRTAADLLGDDKRDDIPDPVGKSRRAFRKVLDEVEDLTARLLRLAWPGAG